MVSPGRPEGRDMDLERWFPTLPAALVQDDIVVLWSYDFRGVQPAWNQRLFGGLVLKRRAR